MNWMERWLSAVFGADRRPQAPKRPHLWGFRSIRPEGKVWHRRRHWWNKHHARGVAGVWVDVWRWVWIDGSKYDGAAVRRLQGLHGVRPSREDRMARRAA